jgi:glycosyltransferase involved in cell wall biosynthesis
LIPTPLEQGQTGVIDLASPPRQSGLSVMPETTILMTAAHAGYDSEKIPLGGGAAICERLCRTWAPIHRVELLGSGPTAPQGIAYSQIDLLDGRHPADLNELRYARFCRDFEKACTEKIIERARRGPVVVVTHDISEGPDFAALARHGVPCVPIFHVDVVDFFCRMYLRNWISPSRAARLFEALRPFGVVPDLLRLVFDKQSDAVEHCPALVVPSMGMKDVLRECYPRLCPGKIHVVPWGSQSPVFAEEALELKREELRQAWGLSREGTVLLTLSRISPEKGQDRLLEALMEAEAQGELPENIALVIAGSAAYMGGGRFLRRLHRLAAKLKRVRVIFPGHLGGLDKAAALSLADLMVVPSRHESYGLTTMEGMAAGLPIVAIKSYGTQATLANGGGVLVDSAQGLWPAIRRLLQESALRREFSDQARSRAGSETFEHAQSRLFAIAAALGIPEERENSR